MKNKFLFVLILAILISFSGQTKVKYIFYFIGDGMGMGHVNAAQLYNRTVLNSKSPLLMMTFPIAGQVTTYSYSSPITDSAAAGTALSSGEKTKNGMVGENSDSTSIYSIARELQEHGYKIGIASTVALNDATPASFYGHTHNRNESKILTEQAAKSGYNFLGGPMFRNTVDKTGEMEKEWMNIFNKNGYKIFSGYKNYINTDCSEIKGKMLLLSQKPQGEHVGYTIDSIPETLTAAQLTNACLNHMSHIDADKFFIMVEGGNIDWAAHANDGGTVIKEILNYQQAIAIAYQFYLAHPEETLIVVTADHDTGGMSFGREDNQKRGNIALTDCQRISKGNFSDWCKTQITKGIEWQDMKDFIATEIGLYNQIEVSEKEDSDMQQLFYGTFISKTTADEKTLYDEFNPFAAKVFDIFNKKIGIGWTTTYHTGNLVPIYAIGKGCEKFSGLLDNTQIPGLILNAAYSEK